ncbi:MAG: hypothetical protein H7259_02350, partial [Cytophagales bacterium]|nr:hypothetical protein [Cytophaga sp.]
MENNNRFIAVIVFLVFSISGQAQTNPYILYLKDKQGIAYTLSDPSAYLSPKSLQRRINQNIVIDSTDLPVSEQYQNEIKSFGATIIYTSRWLNAVYIQADAGQYAQIKNLPFIQAGIQSFRIQDQINTHQTEAVCSASYSDSFSDFLGITEMHRQHLTGDGVLIAITDSGFPGSDTLTAFKHLWNLNKV